MMKNIHLIFMVFFIAILFLPATHADRGGDSDDDDEASWNGIEAEDMGSVALWMMIGTLFIIVWKPLHMYLRQRGPELFDIDSKSFKLKLKKFNTKHLSIHTILGFLTAIVGTVHGLLLDWHWTLWVGMVCVWILVISGSLLKWKWPPQQVRKGARLLHMQRALSIIAVVMLLIGHTLVD
ncbi:MAG: hypothetical protein O3A74_04160 [archaeon]|nr:hypothetical protein [archaeon]